MRRKPKDEKFIKFMESYKSNCCNADWMKVGPVNIRCRECTADITLDIVYTYKEMKEQ